MRSQSPHGDVLKIDCAGCHDPSGWTTIKKELNFDHDSTKFPLEGGHISISCKECHSSLIFSESPSQCNACHTDIHNMTAGNDCGRCHTPQSWIVNNIPELHEEGGFPLTGAHSNLSCADCHTSETNLVFNRIGNDCYSCHNDDYLRTVNPNHQLAGFSVNCLECHDPGTTGWDDKNFTHDFFPLTGKHDIQDCRECHTTGNYADASPLCVSCHLADYNSTTDPDHATSQFPTDCIRCHDESGWTPSSFVHSTFPLLGAHAAVTDCNLCHHGNFTTTPNTCEACHLPDYNTTTSPNHTAAQFSTDCRLCHDETGWLPSTLDHSLFPFVGAHVPLANDCNQCHHGNYVNTPNTCDGCHMPDYNATLNPNHSASQLSTDCKSCHDQSAWIPSTFTHAIFPLVGAHAAVTDCNLCHHGIYTNTPNTCDGCHTPDYNATSNPNHSVAQLSTDCILCHDETAWIPSNLDHSIFPFNGAHSPIANDCNLCHNGNYINTPNTCDGCHMQDYNSTVNPNHSVSQLPTDCILCHDETAWIPSSFDHSIFPFVGAHAPIANDCYSCHNGNYVNTPNDCDGCHMPDYTATTNPNHSSAQFPTDCALCHDETAWIPSSFTHNTFPLLGAHAAVPNCNQCHNGNYTNTPNTCDGCHMPDYTATTNPNHSSAQFPTDCALCHDETAWIPSSYNHSSFPLLGAHASVPNCNQCHNGNYTNTPNTCNGCHMPDYTATTNPNHSSAQFPTDCALCHDETAWIPSSFTHNTFPLLGAHAAVPNCNQCHNGNYTNTPNTCDGCHMPDYTATTNPNHSSAQFVTDCSVCHNETAWIPSSYNHSIYPLLGAHASVPNCNQCHNGNYTNTPNTCNGCHMPAYTASTNPNHSAAQFPTDCVLCHDETAWIPSGFTHSSYPLNGAHASISNCNDCHHGNYTSTPNTCNGCHMPDYAATSNPNHSSAQFPTDCAICHNESAWTPSSYNHSSFPLLGAHASITNCNLCHNGNYTNTPNTCAGCHIADYNAATNPNHSASGFSTNCTTCHNESAWTPSSFNHDAMYFPIYSGKHNGEWNSCSDCHTNSGNYAIFSCINCHEHNNQNSVNNDHNGVSGYAYNSIACFNCHPNGNN